jgi:hypothetical protein
VLSKAVYFFRWKSAAIFIPPAYSWGFLFARKGIRVAEFAYEVNIKNPEIL